MAQLNFDATNVTPEFGLPPSIPAGWYNAMIDESEMKPTRDGTGAYLETRFNVIDGQYAGRKVFMRLNIRNTNPVAQEIAYKQLSAIAHAVGILHVQDSAQLHGIPMKIKVKIRKDTSGQYEDQNEISAVKNINEQVEMAPAGQVAPAASQGFGGMPPGFGAPMQQPAGQQFTPNFAPPAPAPANSAPMSSFAPPPQPAPAQPWQQPAPQQAPAGFAPQQAPQAAQAPAQAAPVQQPWQPPAAAQPWQQQPAPTQAAPMQQPAPTQPHPAQSAVPPWAQPQQ